MAVAEGHQAPEADEQEETLVKAPGEPGHGKTRWTLVARQLIHGYFGKADPTGKLLRVS